MQTVTVSEKGQVVIPVQIRRRLGIAPGCQLNFSLEGQVIHVEIKRQLADFDVALAMREATRDRS